jgi:signal transduction histidine kinase
MASQSGLEVVRPPSGGLSADGDWNFSPFEGYIFTVDEDRRFISSVPELEEAEVRRFETAPSPGLRPLVTAALNGEEGLGDLSANVPNNQLAMAVPVQDRDGRVVGALGGIVQLPNLTGPLMGIIAGSAAALIIPAAILGTIFGFLTAWRITRRIQRLGQAAQSWSQGDFSTEVKDRSKDELGQLTRELNSMAGELENLIQARGELATLETRNRFARDLHDSVKQQVFATSMQIAAARAFVNKSPEEAENHLAQAHELVRQAQKELNVLIHEMRPAALGDKGLAKALREYSLKWSEGSEIPSEIHVRGEREAPLETEQTVFRIAQEALANVAKHSEASKVELDLIYKPDDLTLRVADDGAGFDPAQNPGEGFGLQSMRERSARRGGHINVESTLGKGTRITCVVPFAGTPPKKGGK